MNVNSIINSPTTGTKLIFFVHLTSTVWATQTHGLPQAYVFYNAFLLASLLWSLAHKDLEEPLFIAIALNAISVIFDAVIIGMHYTSIYNFWSLLFLFLNMILRPLTTILLIRYYNERNDTQINIPGFTTSDTPFGNGRSSYESIDRQNGSQNNPNSGGAFA